jgi:hypothetical protein
MSRPGYSYTLSEDYGRIAGHQHKPLQDLVRHHIESFDFMLEKGISYAVQDLPTMEMLDPLNRKISFFIEVTPLFQRQTSTRGQSRYFLQSVARGPLPTRPKYRSLSAGRSTEEMPVHWTKSWDMSLSWSSAVTADWPT